MSASATKKAVSRSSTKKTPSRSSTKKTPSRSSTKKTVQRVDKTIQKTAQIVAAEPKQQIRREVMNVNRVFWTALLTIVALSLFALVLRSAQANPKRLQQLVMLPAQWLHAFINPFEATSVKPATNGKEQQPPAVVDAFEQLQQSLVVDAFEQLQQSFRHVNPWRVELKSKSITK